MADSKSYKEVYDEFLELRKSLYEYYDYDSASESLKSYIDYELEITLGSLLEAAFWQKKKELINKFAEEVNDR